MRWRFSAILLFCLACLTAISPRACATTYAVEIVECPACGREHVNDVLMSWNSWMNPNGPPPQIGVCPHCLFAWYNNPPSQLSSQQRISFKKAVAAMPLKFSERTRRWIVENIHDVGAFDQSAFEAWMANLSEVVMKGNKSTGIALPQLRVKPYPDKNTLRDQDKLRSQLPDMIRAKKLGLEESYPGEEEDWRMRVLYTNAELIEQGDSLAAEYFLLWATAANKAEWKEYPNPASRNLEALCHWKKKWPDINLASAKLPLITDCLLYAQGKTDLPVSMKRMLSRGKWGEMSAMVLAICTERKDRAATIYLSRRLAFRADPSAGDDVAAYYSTVGTQDDLPLLERYARRLFSKRNDAMSWEGSVRGDIERAIQVIRIKALFTATLK